MRCVHILLFPLMLMFSSQNSSLYGKDRLFGVPPKIWQTYRTKELPRPAEEARKSWLELNPNCIYTFMDDDEIERYVYARGDPAMCAFFAALPLGVMKADLWRYLVITDQGGVYSDIDSICCLPIDYWLSVMENKLNRGKPILLIGMEDENGFCQWTLLATPRHPAMEFACKFILDHWQEKGIDLKSNRFVHCTTGPTIWKSAILSYLGEPTTTKPSVIWSRYQTDKDFKKKINDLGIYLLSYQFFSGFAVIHLNGSTQFEEGYISWQKERQKLSSDAKLK